MTDKRPDPEPGDSVFKDPFTGTTPVGPIQSGPANADEPDEARWRVAAIWFLLALLGFVLMAGIGWYYWGREF